MNTNYSDITALAGAPLWWDESAVPRYTRFHPNKCGVYRTYVAYMVVVCQHCDKHFVVASASDLSDSAPILPNESAGSDPWDQVGSFHYGDPPIHGCTGDTMNTVPAQILEFWRRDQQSDWVREAAHEFACATLR